MRYFAGGNTSQGFCTRFDHILPKEQQKRMCYIKGGPGVGKSSLMKAVGKAAESAGLRVEYFYCSSDPESLDGVAIPEKGAALMDGTAPHVYDPVLPGARDTLVSLGDFLDEKSLRASLEELQQTQRQISWAARTWADEPVLKLTVDGPATSLSTWMWLLWSLGCDP